MAEFLTATETIHVATKRGEPTRTIHAGTALPASDQIVKRNRERGVFRTTEELAEQAEVRHHAVESATRAPGERRNVRIPEKSTEPEPEPSTEPAGPLTTDSLTPDA